jgi:hypothetical protein
MSVAYMHLIIRPNPTPTLVGADIMSDSGTILQGHVMTVVAMQADGDDYEEARSNLIKALDNRTWRWLLDLWRKTERP